MTGGREGIAGTYISIHQPLGFAGIAIGHGQCQQSLHEKASTGDEISLTVQDYCTAGGTPVQCAAPEAPAHSLPPPPIAETPMMMWGLEGGGFNGCGLQSSDPLLLPVTILVVGITVLL